MTGTPMEFSEYKILAYAMSEMDATGNDFIIVLRSNEPGAVRFRSVVLEGWRRFFQSTADMDLEYLEDFIYDLRQEFHENNGSDSNFFESLEDLSAGPLRTSSSGNFKMIDLESIHVEFRQHPSDICACSQEAFNALANHLRETNYQLTAATSPG